MRRAQDRMRMARPYATHSRHVIAHLNQANPDFHHPFLSARAPRAVGIIVISTDRGLCGALNANLFKATLQRVRDWQQRGASVSLCVIGGKAQGFFRRLELPILASAVALGDQPHLRDLIGPVKVMLDAYRDGRIDRLLLVHAQFVNTMTQTPRELQLLPVAPAGETDSELAAHWDYIYEPSAEEILDGLLMRYIESQVYQGAVENVACEMAARMVAMKSASDNASELIDELQLMYNKARQAGITKELAEIVGGAAAV